MTSYDDRYTPENEEASAGTEAPYESNSAEEHYPKEISQQEGISSEPMPERERRIRFYSPRQLVQYEPPDDELLVGDQHIVKGKMMVIGGPPGTGKSRASTELAMCGVTGEDWFGLKVHTPFKTMIIQNENGLTRLMKEYRERAGAGKAHDMIRVSEPPPYGMSFSDPVFRADLSEEIRSFNPDVIVIDPFNAVANDDSQREYKATFDAILGALPKGPEKPALVIVCHTRKPKPDEIRTGGSKMMHLLAGSHILSSCPRSVFIMMPANESDETDRHRVWFNPKNNDGLEAGRSAWRLSHDGFHKAEDFDWESFDKGGQKRVTMRDEFIIEALADSPDRKGAIVRLMKASRLGKRACEMALSEKGGFCHLFKVSDDGYYQLK